MEDNKQTFAYEPVNIFDLQDEETLVIAKFGIEGIRAMLYMAQYLKHNENLENSEISKNTFDEVINDCDEEYTLMKNNYLSMYPDAGWRKFLTMLQYKAELYGKTVILVPPRNTTQTCSVCGYALKGDEKLTLSDREWICPSCGTHHDRDTNAAKNILERGLQIASQS